MFLSHFSHQQITRTSGFVLHHLPASQHHSVDSDLNPSPSLETVSSVPLFLNPLLLASEVGLARWPDIPPLGGEIPVSGADDAEGRVRQQVGEERIAKNGRDGTPKREMTGDGMILRKHRIV